MSRVLDIAAFLSKHGWDAADQQPVAADFSPRRFARLTQPDGRIAILMDADAGQNTPAFVAIAGLLRAAGLSAPEIIAADPPRGLVLMEDLGSRNIGALLDEGAEPRLFYERAVRVLARLHAAMVAVKPDTAALPVFDTDLFVGQAGLLLDICAGDISAAARDGFNSALREALAPAAALPVSLMLRDFMPDNLMDLPERKDISAIGLLDFQDGGIGPIAYDLASLCEVVRRDGGDALLEPMIALYADLRPGTDAAALRLACRALAAQRHLRILGILTKRGGQASRVKRVRAYLQKLLAEAELRPLRDAVAAWL